MLCHPQTKPEKSVGETGPTGHQLMAPPSFLFTSSSFIADLGDMGARRDKT